MVFFGDETWASFFRQGLCDILSDVTLDVMQGDVPAETENVETKSVYLLLNLDGTLPLTGIRSNSFLLLKTNPFFPIWWLSALTSMWVGLYLIDIALIGKSSRNG